MARTRAHRLGLEVPPDVLLPDIRDHPNFQGAPTLAPHVAGRWDCNSKHDPSAHNHDNELAPPPSNLSMLLTTPILVECHYKTPSEKNLPFFKGPLKPYDRVGHLQNRKTPNPEHGRKIGHK